MRSATPDRPPVLPQKLLRLAGVIAVLLPFATCTDFTGPSGRGVQVPIVPSFSPAASFARAVYASAGVSFDRVRILIVRGEAEVLKDTSVAFSPTSTELTLPLLIAAAPGEVVKATLEYRTADLVLYSGTATVTTLPVGSSQSSATPIVLVPVGPGATAATVQMSPTSGVFPVAAPVQFSASAVESSGAVIANPIIAWSVDDASVASVSATGLVQPTSKGGPVKVRATTLNGKFAEASITFVTPPTNILVVSGNNQTAMDFDTLPAPIVVKVVDQNGGGVPDVPVSFITTNGGGSLTKTSVITDVNGQGSTRWVLGGVVGQQSIAITSTALPNKVVNAVATGTERPAVKLAFGQQPTSSLMNASMMPAVTVKALDDSGRVVSGFTGAITVTFDANPTGATLAGTVTANAVAGVASFANLSVNKAGSGYSLKAGAPGLTTALSTTFNVEQVPSGLSLVAGGSQTAAIRSVLNQVSVKVSDANGIGVAGVTVTFAVASGAGSLTVNNGTTDANGIARATWTLGDSVGTQTITATSTGLTGSPLTISATATPLPAVALAFVQQPSNVVVSTGMTPPVTVKAVNADGNVVTGFTGTIELVLLNNPNSASLGGTISAAAVSGVASFPGLTVSVAGSGYALKATSGTLTTATSTTFIVAPPPPAAIRFQTQPSNVQAGSVMSPAVQVKIVDGSGNVVPGASTSITLALDNNPTSATLGGTSTVTAVNGVATFSNLAVNTAGTGYTLRATGGGFSEVSTAFNVTAAPTPSHTWTGTTSTDWNTASNWNPSGVPTSADSVNIPAAANSPTIAAGVAARLVVIESGGSLRINYSGDSIRLPKILNKGNLQLTTAITISKIDNRGTIVVDGMGYADSLYNGSGHTVQIKSLSGTVPLLTRVLVNDGTIELTDVSEGGAMLQATDSIVNRVGGNINAVPGSGGERAISGVLRNYGIITISGSQGLNLVHSFSGSVNAGTITSTAGGALVQTFNDSTISFVSTGTISLGTANWQMNLGHLQLRAGGVTGTGVFTTTWSSLDLDVSRLPLTWSIDSLTRFAGDSVVVPSGVTRYFKSSNFAQKVVVQGTLTLLAGDHNAVNFQQGLAIATGATVEAQVNSEVSRSISVASNGTLRVVARDEDRTFKVDTSFTNQGLIELTSTGIWLTNIDVDGMLTNATTGTISALGGYGGERRITGKLANAGAITVAGDSYLKLNSGSVANTNSGTITLLDAATTAAPTAENLTSFAIPISGTTLTNTGTISIGANRTFLVQSGSTLSNAGIVSGVGTMEVASDATLSNSGQIAPGGVGVVGTLTFKGNFSVGTGSVEVDVATMTSADLLQVTGVAAVAGKINVTALTGFVAGAGSLTVVTGASCVGSPVILPSILWGGYNDGCYHIYPFLSAPAPISSVRSR